MARLADEMREISASHEERQRAAQAKLKAEAEQRAAEWELKMAREAKEQIYPEIITSIREVANSGLAKYRYVLARVGATPTNYAGIVVPVLTRLLEADGFTVGHTQEKAAPAPGMNAAVAAGVDTTDQVLNITW